MMRFTLKQRDNFIGLILYCVGKHGSTSTVSHYDMIQAGYIGMAKALKSFDAKKCPLKNWVYRFINSEIIKCRYKNGKERREDSGFDDIIVKKLTNKTTPVDEIIEGEDDMDRHEDLEGIYKVLNGTNPFLSRDRGLNRRIFKDRIINGCRIVDLVKKYNLTYASISHRVAKVCELIRSEVC